MNRPQLTDAILWVTDPWNQLRHPTDGTLRLAQAALGLGIPSYWCDVRSIHIRSGKPVAAVVKPFLGFGPDRAESSIRFGAAATVPIQAFGKLIYRPDPPVNTAYRFPLQMIREEMLRSPGLKVLNPPELLLSDSEKLLGILGPDFFPESLITSDAALAEEFGVRQGRTVLKPLNDARARGVELLRWTSPAEIEESRRLLREASVGHTIPVALQKYLSAVHTQGETRLWFSNGRLLASARKIPQADEFRFCSLEGGRVEAHPLTPEETQMAARLSQILRERRICMAAVDLLEARVTDFNFTSPGLIVDLERVCGYNFAEDIVRGFDADL